MIRNVAFATMMISGILFSRGAFAAGGTTDDAFRLGMSAWTAGRFTEAREIWQVLADHENDPNSEEGIGFIYHSGLGVPVDNVAAANWFRKAAVQGQPDAQMMLGILYYYGWGVDQSFATAFAWCDLAENNGAGGGCRGAALESLPTDADMKAAFALGLKYRELYGDLK